MAVQEVFEGCLTRLDGEGPIHLILSCTIDFLDSSHASRLELDTVVLLVCIYLFHSLSFAFVP